MKENFFLISSGCMSFYPENKRASFKNDLPKSLSFNESSSIGIEKVFFDQNFTTYEGTLGTPDIISSDTKTNTSFFISLCDNICDLASKISQSLIEFTHISNQKENIFSIKVNNNKIELIIKYGVIFFSKKLFDFLKFENPLEILNIEGDTYYVLSRIGNPHNQYIYSSYEDIDLNEKKLDYINLICKNVEAYESVKNDQQVICRIPISSVNQSRTIFYEPFHVNYFKIEGSYIRTIKIMFKQPNGKKVYFRSGAPNIIKSCIMSFSKMDFFHVTFSSGKTDLFPFNSGFRFQVDLSKSIQLDGDWGVSVTSAYIPPPQKLIIFDSRIHTLNEGDNYFCVCFDGPNHSLLCKKIPLLELTKKELCIFLEREFHKYLSVFLDEYEKIYLIPKYKDNDHSGCMIFTTKSVLAMMEEEEFFYNLLPTNVLSLRQKARHAEVLVKIHKSNLTVNNMRVFKISTSLHEAFTIKKSFMMFEAITFYNIGKIEDALISQIDNRRLLKLKTTDFVRREEMRLIENFQDSFPDKMNEYLPSYLFIYCDFVRETAFSNKYVNLLKMIPYKNGHNKLPGGLFNSHNDDFYIVNKNILKTLDFSIRTHSGKEFQFLPTQSNVIISLKFQKM